MVDQHVPWWNNPIMPKVASVLLAILTFVMAQREVPVLLDHAQDGALRTVGVFLWPLALVPWLVGLSGKRQLLGLFLGTSVGYLLMGMPLVVSLHGILLPSSILPQAILAILGGFNLLIFLENYAKPQRLRVLLWVAPVVGMGLLLIALHPTTVVLRLQPGELKPNPEALAIVETYELESEPVAAYTYEDVLVVIGQEELLWRNPQGQTQIRPGQYAPRQVKVHCDGQRLYIVELISGRIECYGYPHGELLWARTDLGRISDMAWTADYAWALNCLDETIYPWPEEMEAVLHQVDLKDGQVVSTTTILPPNNLFWKRPNYGALALLESTAEQAWVRGLSSPQKPIYREHFYYEESEDDQAFIYRPAQGDLEELLHALPDGLSPFRDFADKPTYYLVGDIVVDVWPGYTYTESIIRVRSLVTGQVLWQQPLARESPPTLFDAQGKVMVDNEQGVLCLDLATGSEYWRYPHQSQLRWTEALDEDLLFGLANGTIVRMGADGKPLWQYAAQGFTYLEQVDATARTVTIIDSGIKEGEGLPYTVMGKYVTLSLTDGSVVPSAKPQLAGGKYAVSGEYLWYMKQFSYDPGPYNGAKAIYRLAGQRVTVRDLNMFREDILVRPDFLLIAEQQGSKARLSILRVKD